MDDGSPSISASLGIGSRGQWYSRARAAISCASDSQSLERIRVELMGRKGLVTRQLRQLSGLEPDERRAKGRLLNRLRDELAQAILERQRSLQLAEWDERLKHEYVDVTLPVPPYEPGKLHPISCVIDQLVAIFGSMGFHVIEGPDIEDDFHNFDALNIPPDHPARQEHDSFYLPALEKGLPPLLLRTHTSPAQIRAMSSISPPLRVISPGRVYRADDDATHTPNFHQLEAIAIDRDLHMGHLKGCLIDFCRAFFQTENLPVRFRPSYFPFTEPSAEVDIGYKRLKNSVEISAHGEWLEILGSGMVHPHVIESCGLDPKIWQGFAFGLGIERIAMLKYGIADLRAFYESDPRWLVHYGLSPVFTSSIHDGLD